MFSTVPTKSLRSKVTSVGLQLVTATVTCPMELGWTRYGPPVRKTSELEAMLAMQWVPSVGRQPVSVMRLTRMCATESGGITCRSQTFRCPLNQPGRPCQENEFLAGL